MEPLSRLGGRGGAPVLVRRRRMGLEQNAWKQYYILSVAQGLNTGAGGTGMKKILAPIVCLLLVAGCGKSSKEIDLSKDTAESADFSSADLQRITDGMMNSIQLSAKGLDNNTGEHVSEGLWRKEGFITGEREGQKLVMLLAKELKNNTDEHINTRLILEKMRTRMVNEGLAEFVDDQAFDMALEQLSLQASDLYDDTKAAKIGRFVGAKYILRGTISNIRKREGRENSNYQNVTMDIFEIETLLIKWTDEVEFKRVTKKGMFR
jgi:hypothetical protein